MLHVERTHRLHESAPNTDFLSHLKGLQHNKSESSTIINDESDDNVTHHASVVNNLLSQISSDSPVSITSTTLPNLPPLHTLSTSTHTPTLPPTSSTSTHTPTLPPTYSTRTPNMVSSVGLPSLTLPPVSPEDPASIVLNAHPDTRIKDLPLTTLQLNMVFPYLARTMPFAANSVSSLMMSVNTACRLEMEAQIKYGSLAVPRHSNLESLREAELAFLQPTSYPASVEDLRDVNMLHPVRFSPWPTCKTRELEIRRAREGGQMMIVSFDLSHLSLTDQISCKAWKESSNLGSNALSCILFTKENARRQASASILQDKEAKLGEVERLADVQEAFFLLCAVRRRYWPLDTSTETLAWFLLKNRWFADFCHTEKQRAHLACSFIDFIIRVNAHRYCRLEAPLDMQQLNLEANNFINDHRIPPSNSDHQQQRIQQQRYQQHQQHTAPRSRASPSFVLCRVYNTPNGCSRFYDSATNTCVGSTGDRRLHGCTVDVAGKPCGQRHTSMAHSSKNRNNSSS